MFSRNSKKTAASFSLPHYHKKHLFFLTLLASLTLGNGAARAEASIPFTFPGETAEFYDVSNTGTVIGTNEGGAYVWYLDGSTLNIATILGAGYSGSDAYAISSDGAFVVGTAYTVGSNVDVAFLWGADSGVQVLGTLGGTDARAFDVSSDGSTVVGFADNAAENSRAFIWTSADGMVDLGTLGGTTSQANAISEDGSTVAGFADNAAENHIAFVWTSAGGMVSLGTLGGSTSEAKDVSADGSVVVGFATVAAGNMPHAFVWTSAGGMVDLGTLGGSISGLVAVSADGSVGVGTSYLEGDAAMRAAYWTQTGGLQNLNTVLADAGVDLTNIVLMTADNISSNGEYIVAGGTTSDVTHYYLIHYTDSTAGVTTAAQQQQATENMSQHQRAMMVNGRATAGQILGFSRAPSGGNTTTAGVMLGSAIGYACGQYTREALTVFGGLAYGAQDYKNIEQDNAVTLAAGARYMFPKFWYNDKKMVPFVEAGGWVTPSANLTMKRVYGNGAGTSTGVGSTEATSYAVYARGGAFWEFSPRDRLLGYVSLDEQFMDFQAYTESTASNPFPATVADGTVRLDIARLGGAWTHDLARVEVPVSVTLSGSLAYSYGGQSGLRTTVAGIGTSQASFKNALWGEFGASMAGQINERTELTMGINGTAGGDGIGAAIHGGMDVSFKF